MCFHGSIQRRNTIHCYSIVKDKEFVANLLNAFCQSEYILVCGSNSKGLPSYIVFSTIWKSACMRIDEILYFTGLLADEKR